MMSKTSQSNFYKVLRNLIAKNATVIIAGHANKHLDADGNIVYEGTSDTMNDIDCAYAIYQISNNGSDYTVEFRNEKARGNVVPHVSYGYAKKDGGTYYDILDSVHELDRDQESQSKRENIKAEKRTLYEAERLFVLDVIKSEPMNYSQILSKFSSGKYEIVKEFSKAKLDKALRVLDGIDWETSRGDKNAKIYSIKGTRANIYNTAKDGD